MTQFVHVWSKIVTKPPIPLTASALPTVYYN